MDIKITSTLYKLAQGYNLLSCSKHFAIGISTMSRIIRQVVRAINIVYRDQIKWPRGPNMENVMRDFKAWCCLPNIHGAIDGTHMSIARPLGTFTTDYYYFKIGGHSMVAQAIVDCNKKLTDLVVGMLGSVNDSRIP